MPELQPIRGTRDLIGEDQLRHQHVIDTARRIAALYGFEEWSTPLFEDTRVFTRTLGETSDVVTKEMYTFTDRGGELLTLRPEATAGICRALVSNGLTQTLPQKVFYTGPMFRYERPQKGRYRQFHQIDIELIGSPEPLADAEVIACGWDVLSGLGVAADTTLEVNTLGDRASRDAYRSALVSYFQPHKHNLSEDSLNRLERNPLRILDSKDERDKRILADAPTIVPYLTEQAAKFYADLKRHLDRFGVPYRENPRIVRGLDYYGHTAFEFVTTRLGAQGTVLGGGRYRRAGGGDGRSADPCGRLGGRYRTSDDVAGFDAPTPRPSRNCSNRRRRRSGSYRPAPDPSPPGYSRRNGLSRQSPPPHGACQQNWRSRGGDPR